MKQHTRIKSISLIGLMTAVICVMSPFSIPLPFSPVPITLGFLAIYFTLFALGMVKGTISCLIYILLGLVGLPVFSGFSGGAGKLFGPTGGYIIGYIFLAPIAGFFIDKFASNWQNWYLCLLGMILGSSVCYFFGTLMLALQMQISFYNALWLGVIPYIPADLCKMAIALLVGLPLRRTLIRADLV